MDVLLVRHGEAADGGPDAARPLTAKGREEMERIARGLEVIGVRLDRIAHSPLLRAVETAELLAPLLVRGGTTEVSGHLAEPPSEALLSLLDGDGVALVGHQPWMSELLGLLVHGTRASSTCFEFKKGAVAWLEGTPSFGGMALKAFLPPSVTKKLAR